MYIYGMSEPNSYPVAGKGRGADGHPANRFLQIHQELDLEHLTEEDDYLSSVSKPRTEYLPDSSQTIVTENNSPDIFFRYSVNPYRGCAHGCSYCYARPTHEYLGLSAGLDFETKVIVKHRAPELLTDWLARPKWVPEPITFSGVTDCYQPIERELKLTRSCLSVAAECRQPIGIVTKNALVARDIDLLAEMAKWRGARVAVSITTLDAELARKMEPRTSSPEARLRTIKELSAAGVPTVVMVAPIIPGLNDSEMPAILQAAAEAGAQAAAYTLLRLPWSVEEVFFHWLDRCVPTKAERVRSHIRSTRDGKNYDSQFGTRMRGTGEFADQINKAFQVFHKRCGFDRPQEPLDCSHFRPPRRPGQQITMF